MEHHQVADIGALLWFLGWLMALGVLFVLALRLPLQLSLPTRRSTRWSRVYVGIVVGAALGTAILANLAVSLHDMHLDLTREKIFTPSAAALEVVDRLTQAVKLTYFFRGEDQGGRRAADIVKVMARRNPLLEVITIDPDKEPNLARSAGLNLYNAAVIEAAGRRVTVHSTEEVEIAIGIQRVLRERVVTACFMQGHQEYPMDGDEFHTHLEAGAGHAHDDASSAIVQTSGHGVGRLRRILEGLGYDAMVITPAIDGAIPASCSLVINAGPRSTYLPDETRALQAYLAQGGSLMLLYDLGFVLEPALQALLARLGLRFPQSILVDPTSHYGKDPETVAVTAYDPHPITRRISLTFFPGVRPIELLTPSAGIHTRALITSSQDSYSVPVAPVAQRQVHDADKAAAAQAVETQNKSVPGSQIIAAIAQGRLRQDSAQAFRVVAIGDADFMTNSFFPYMANSDLTLALVRWLAHEERSTAITSRIPVPSLVLLTDAQARTIFVLLEILLPLLVMACGVVIWWRRR